MPATTTHRANGRLTAHGHTGPPSPVLSRADRSRPGPWTGGRHAPASRLDAWVTGLVDGAMLGLAVFVLLGLAGLLAGCAAPATTRVDGPKAEAREHAEHDRGETRTETRVRVRLTPAHAGERAGSPEGQRARSGQAGPGTEPEHNPDTRVFPCEPGSGGIGPRSRPQTGPHRADEPAAATPSPARDTPTGRPARGRSERPTAPHDGGPLAALAGLSVGVTGGQGSGTGHRASGTERAPRWAEMQRLIDAAADRGMAVEIELDEVRTEPGERRAETRTEHRSGPDLATRSTEAALGFRGGAGSVAGPWGANSWGAWGLDATLISRSGVRPLALIGGLVMAAALIPLVLPPRRVGLAASISLVGLSIVLTDVLVQQYPWVALIAGLLVIGGAAYLAYEAWRAGRVQLALGVLEREIETAADEGRGASVVVDRVRRDPLLDAETRRAVRRADRARPPTTPTTPTARDRRG